MMTSQEPEPNQRQGLKRITVAKKFEGEVTVTVEGKSFSQIISLDKFYINKNETETKLKKWIEENNISSFSVAVFGITGQGRVEFKADKPLDFHVYMFGEKIATITGIGYIDIGAPNPFWTITIGNPNNETLTIKVIVSGVAYITFEEEK